MNIAIWLTTAGVFVSICLFTINLLTLLTLKKENKRREEQLKGDIIQKIAINHRAIFQEAANMSVSGDMKELFPESYSYGSFLGSMIMNHVHSVFRFHEKGLIDEEDWDGIQNDIYDLITWPLIQKRWPEIKRFYTTSYVKFIDDLATLGIRKSR